MHALSAALLAERSGLGDSLALAERETMQIQHRQIAGAPALIIDGVYADPHAVRQLALKLDFARSAGLYPGHFAALSIRPRGLEQLLNTLLEPLLKERLVFSPYYGETTFAIIDTPPEALMPMQRQPHYDTFCDVAGVIYLDPNPSARGGTSFWRHRASGMTRAAGRRGQVGPEVAREVERMLLAGLTDLPDGYLVDTNAHWALTDLVEMKFNRLVVYDARAFHSPHISAFERSADRTRARLTQSLFLDIVPARETTAGPDGG